MHATISPTAAGRRASAARSWPRALALSAAALYLPQLLPLVATDVARQASNLSAYARHFPVLSGLAPGVSARIASGVGEPLEEYVLLAVALLVTGVLLGGTALALRRWPRAGLAVALATALVSALLATAAAGLIQA